MFVAILDVGPVLIVEGCGEVFEWSGFCVVWCFGLDRGSIGGAWIVVVGW